MIQLVLPSARRHASWVQCMREFAGETLHGFSTFGFDEARLNETAEFARWLAREQRQRCQGIDGFVPATVWWIVDDAEPGVVLGSIHLRHELNDRLRADGGHIGYGVRPSARGRGVATAALRLCLEKAKALGLDRVLIVCDADNPPSRGAILAVGGVLEDAPNGLERHWVAL